MLGVGSRGGRAPWWMAVLVAALGCRSRATAPAAATEMVVRAATVVEKGTSITPAGFVTLGTSAQAVNLGPRGHFQADLALSNGGVDVGSAGQAVAPWRVLGNFAVEPQAVVTGNLTLGGTLAQGAQSTINGTVVQHATVAKLAFPSTAAMLSQLGTTFGSGQQPDIFLGPGQSTTLTAGGKRVGNVTLQQGATLTVNTVSALEVLGAVNLGPQARISVRNGGRLLLYVHQSVETSTDAVIEQAGQSLGRGLIVALGSGATMHWGTNAQFGPGLVYGVEPPGSTKQTTLLDIVRANGALVASVASTNPTSQITLVSRFLACLGGLAPVTVTLLHPQGRSEREVAPGVTSVPIAGAIGNLPGLDALTIQDAGTARTLAVAADGTFSGSATLRSDGEPTNICVVAQDCVNRTTQSCVLVGVRHAIDLVFTSPTPGDRVSVAAINITGRVIGGTASSITGNGIAGGTLQGAFTIPQVPLAVGGNVVTVEAHASTGDVIRRRLFVVRGGTTDVWDAQLEIDNSRHVTLLNRSAVHASPFPLVRLGTMSYRLLDPTGLSLYESPIPGTNDSTSETVDVNGQPVATAARPFRFHVPVRVPVVAAAQVIQFLDESGQEVGRQSL
jgi:hypothetical protein